MIEVKPLTEETLRDAEEVVRSRFDESAIAILHKEMRNPLRKLCNEVGDIAYEDGVPVCFQAAILRRLYLGQKEIIGVVGGLTCIKREASIEALIDVRAAANKERGNCILGFGNSQNAETAAMARKMSKKVALPPPESCTRFIWAAIRPFDCFVYFVRRKLIKASVPNWKSFDTTGIEFSKKVGAYEVRRVSSEYEVLFDSFQADYLSSNKGLFSSRSSEEMMWMFGERLKSGRAVMLSAYENGKSVGYIILDGHGNARRWMIVDLIALRNDKKVIDALLDGAKRFLRKKTPAMMMETTGYPSFIQATLMRYLPHVRNVGHNQFSWGSKNQSFREKVIPLIDTDKIWFFGIYDGDLCM